MNTDVKVPRFFFFAVLTSLFLAIFYSTITNMSGLYVVSELGGSGQISIYEMVFFGLGSLLSIPLTDPLSQRWGTISLLTYALILYTLFSILCGLAPTFFMFNFYRFGLGFSSGFFFLSCRELCFRFTSKEIFPRYVFYMQLIYALCPIVGACFGSYFAYESHWRWIFHFNEVVSLSTAAYLWFCCRHMEHKPYERAKVNDKTGYIFFAIGVSCIVIALTLSQQLDWYRSTLFLTLLAIGIPSFIFFVIWDFSHPEPTVKLHLLKLPQLRYTMLYCSLFFSAYFGMILLIPLWLTIYTNYTVIWVSAILGIMAIVAVAAYFVFQALHKYKVNPYFFIIIAALCFSFSCYYSTYFNTEIDFIHLAIARFFAGLGLVFFFLPIVFLTVTSYTSHHSIGAFGLYQIVRVFSSNVGAALYVILWQRRQAFFHERLGEALTPNAPLTAQYFEKAQKIFHLTPGQSKEQLDVLLTQHATSLALNDVFCCMGYICLGIIPILLLSFYYEQKKKKSNMTS